MKVSVRFTDRYVQNLKPKASRYEVREDNAHGNGALTLRVSPNGSKSWQYLYTFDGRDRRMTLGAYPAMSVAEAHEACGKAMVMREHGKDPAAISVAGHVAAREAPTLQALADRFMEEYARPKKAAKSVLNDERTLKRDVLPHLGKHKAEAIERKDVRALLRAIADRGAPIQANRTLALIRKLYNWGVSEDLVKTNPCIGLTPPGKENPRQRVLTDGELKAFLAKLPTAQIADEGKLALQFQLLTAQRCGEVLALRWDETDLPKEWPENALVASAWWTIPAAKAKNRKEHRVPLSCQALDILARARVLNPDRQTVFPSPRGDKPMVETALGRAVNRNLDHFKVPAFTPHDLRRTAATHMTTLEVPRLVVSKLLNHVDSEITGRYDRHSYDAQKLDAVEQWGQKVAEIDATIAKELRERK